MARWWLKKLFTILQRDENKTGIEKEFDCNIKDFEAIEVVKDSKYPILLSAGSNENLDEMFEMIKKANPNETDIVILPGCNHGNGMYKQTELYQGRIIQYNWSWKCYTF